MIDFQNISHVFLDMDGTLLDLNFDNHFWQEFVPQRYADRRGLTLEVARTELAPLFKATEGRLEWYCLDYWSEHLGLDLAGMKAEVAGLIAVLPHVTEFLDYLKTWDLRLLLVTNAHRRSLAVKMEKTCLHAFFDRIVVSHDLGLPKEDPAFWERLRALEPFDSERTLLVDDSLPVLRSARQFGLGHLRAIRRNDSTRPPREIAEFPAIHDFRELMPGRCGPSGPRPWPQGNGFSVKLRDLFSLLPRRYRVVSDISRSPDPRMGRTVRRPDRLARCQR
jgi:putative hydrolase of the HAD superfamily